MLGKIVASLLLALAAILAAAAPASAYSASQAEAMTDPSHADPYTFPNVKPCCGAKPDPCANGRCRSVAPPRARPCWERPSGCQKYRPRPRPRPVPVCRGRDCDDDDGYVGPGDSLDFRCDGGGDTRTLQEAIEIAQRSGGIVRIHGYSQGGLCREPLRVTGRVTLVGVPGGPTNELPELAPPPGPCLVVSGRNARATVSGLRIVSESGPACLEVNGGTLSLEGVNVNATRSGAGVVVRSGWFYAGDSRSTRERTVIISGGPAVVATASDVGITRGTVLQTIAAFAFSGVPYQPYGPAYPVIRYIADDPDAPYMGGGRIPEANSWPSGAPAPERPRTPVPVNDWQPTPGPSYPQPYPPARPYTPPPYTYPAAPTLNPEPAPFQGTPVVVLQESQAVIDGADILGGTSGVAVVLSSSSGNRTLRIRNSRILSKNGDVGLVAVAAGGWTGQPSRLIVDGGLTISGFDTGINLIRAGVQINGVDIDADEVGIRADKSTNGSIYAPRVNASRCFRIDDSSHSGDYAGKYLTISGSVCR